MGDALSTYFEARATAASYSNVNAGLPCGVREGVAEGAKGGPKQPLLLQSFAMKPY